MQTSYDNNTYIFNDPEWYFLGEYNLSELIADVDLQGEFSARPVHQTIAGLGIAPECLNNIERTLKRFAKEAMRDLDQGRSESPVTIRLFCQKKTVEDVNSAKSARQFNAELTLEPNLIIHQPDSGINGGWGCFLIKKGGNDSEDASPSSHYFVDLYLYREGK